MTDDGADEKVVEVETKDKKVKDEDKVILVTEPTLTRYTLAQAKQQRDMAQSMVATAQEQLVAAQAQVDEAEEVLKL